MPSIVKKIEDEIVNKELVPLMEPFYVDEIIYYTSDEFSDRVRIKGKTVHVSWEELNEKYNLADYYPVDGRLVRICDHFSALMEADISIRHGITFEHLKGGRDGMLVHYGKDEIISGINVYDFFNNSIL